MRKLLLLAVAMLAGTLAFGQNDAIDEDVDTFDTPAQSDEQDPDSRGRTLEKAFSRAGAALDRALNRLESETMHIEGIEEIEALDPFGEFEDADSVAFVPFQIAFTPGLAVPFGYYDVGISGAAIGALHRDVLGVSGAGIFNISRDIQGAEAAGVFNLARNIQGIQSAGVFGIAEGDVEGVQLGGVFNIAEGSVEGAQLGGVFNIAGDVQGFQAAGIFNIARSYQGPVQAAGVFNIAGRVDGAQAAGIFNIAEDINGLQASSIVNVAGRVQGLQVGLVNIADHMDGVQLGLINIARNGISGVGEFWETNSDYRWAYWQNGTREFYTVFMGGVPRDDAFNSAENLVVSAGAGSRLDLGRAYIDLEMAALWDVGAAAQALYDGLGDRSMYAIHEGMPGMFQAFGDAAAFLPSRPWPSVRVTLGLPIVWRLELVGGLRMDFDPEGWPALPERMKDGDAHPGQDILGLRFDAYTKWFLGFRI